MPMPYSTDSWPLSPKWATSERDVSAWESRCRGLIVEKGAGSLLPAPFFIYSRNQTAVIFSFFTR